MKKTKDELLNTNELLKTVNGKILLASHGLCLDTLINDEHWFVRKEVAKQGYGLDKLVNDDDEYVRAEVAERKLKEKGEK